MRGGKIRTFLNTAASLGVGIYAAHACYFLILAVFPALVLVMGLLRFTGLRAEALLQLLTGFVPQALMGYVQRLVSSAYENSSKALLGFSAVTALWSASRGIFGVLTGFNAVYGVSEDRGYLYTRGVSLLYTLLFILVLLLTLVVSVFGETLLGLLPGLPEVVTRLIDLRVAVMLMLQTALFTAMYAVLPNRRNRIRDSLPGALLASLGWTGFSKLFSVYVENFSGYSSIYGSVYAVGLSMLWLYCCVSILFGGAVLNRLLMTARWGKKGLNVE